MKNWDNDIKRQVRLIIAGLAAGKNYSKIGDLPGNQLLSTIEFVIHNVVSPTGECILFENNEDEIQAIIDGVKAHGIPNCDLKLVEDVAEVRQRHLNNMGFFNYDSMSHLKPRGLHLIDRIGWVPGAAMAITLYHSDTRSKSRFLEHSLNNFNNVWDTGHKNIAMAELSRVYHYLTYSNTGGIIHEHRNAGPSRVIDKHITYSSMLYMLLKYALRNHTYNLRCAILYSGSRGSIAARMITFYIDDITKHTQPDPGVMYMDQGDAFMPMVREINNFYS